MPDATTQETPDQETPEINQEAETPLTDEQVAAQNAVFQKDVYVQCKHCLFFVDQNSVTKGYDGPDTIKMFGTYFEFADGETIARYLHLDDGDTEHDHDAEPGLAMTGEEWHEKHPELFPLPGEDMDDGDSGYQARRKREFGGVVFEVPEYEADIPRSLTTLPTP